MLQPDLTQFFSFKRISSLGLSQVLLFGDPTRFSGVGKKLKVYGCIYGVFLPRKISELQ